MQNQLRVYPNPFTFLDHEGLPAGTFPFDPSHGQGARRWVGARIDTSPGHDGKPRTRALDGKRTEADFALTQRDAKGRPVKRVEIKATPDQRVVFAFDVAAPTTLPVTPHYVRAVRDGSLIAADVETATAVGQRFQPPRAVLAEHAAAAVARWSAEQGAPPPIDSWPAELLALLPLAEHTTSEPVLADEPGGNAP